MGDASADETLPVQHVTDPEVIVESMQCRSLSARFNPPESASTYF
jgi:hypothetical protein